MTTRHAPCRGFLFNFCLKKRVGRQQTQGVLYSAALVSLTRTRTRRLEPERFDQSKVLGGRTRSGRCIGAADRVKKPSAWWLQTELFGLTLDTLD